MNEIYDAIEKLENGQCIYAHLDFKFTESNYNKIKLKNEDVGKVYIQSQFKNFKEMWKHGSKGEAVSKDVFILLYKLGKLRFVAAGGRDEANGLVKTMFEYVPSCCYLGVSGEGLSPTSDRHITSTIPRSCINRSEEYRYIIEQLANYCELVVKSNGAATLVHNKYKQPICISDYEVDELKSLKYTQVRKNDKNETIISFREWFIKSVINDYEDLEGEEALRFFLTPDEFGEYPSLDAKFVPYDELVNDKFNMEKV